MVNRCDVVVIGLGPGGEAAATELAQAGLAVVAVDERLVGGECPYYGCIPSKMVIRAADVLAEGRRIAGLAGAADVRPDWSAGPRPGSATRPPTTGTTGGGGAARGRRRPVRARPRPTRRHRARSRWAASTYEAASGRRAQHRHRAGGSADRGARGHAVLDQPRRPPHRVACPGRWSSSAAGRSGPSSRRRWPGSAYGSPSSSSADRILATGGAGGGRCRRRRVRARGHPGADRRHDRRCRTTTAGSASPLDDQELDAEQGAGRRGATPQPRRPRPRDRRPRPVRARARGRRADASPARGCGPSATSPARARSRTCRCTSRRSRVRDILGQDGPTADYRAVPARHLHRPRGRVRRA